MRTKPHCMNKSDSLFFLPHTDDRVTPLHFAADGGHTSSVACLLEMGAPVEAEEKKEWARPLHLACFSDHTPCVDLLLSAGADVNARDRTGWTPLHYCSVEGHRAVVLLLLGRGAEVDRRDEKGMTPLLLACEEGHVSVARDLVAHGADVNAKDRGDMTPLITATGGGHVETVEFLVRETEADLEGRDNITGWTALALAAVKGHTHVMEILLAAGAEVDARDSDGGTPLQRACREGSQEGVRLLIDHGADWTLANDFVTPLHFAADGGHTSSVACLLEMGAAVEAEEKEKWRPLHVACDKGHTPCVELLLRAGADINARIRDGQTPLHLCSLRGHRAVVLLLLGRGAEVDCREEGGRTPLLLACLKGHVSVARDLVANGADVNAKDRGGLTPLTWASDGGHVETVEFLVREAKADLEGRENIGGMTALAGAAWMGHTHVMKILLAAGAEVDARDPYGRTPLQLACKKGSLEGARLLIDHGADWTLADDFGGNAKRREMNCHGRKNSGRCYGTQSPFICGLNHVWRQGGSVFFQMPLCDADLHDWMSENAPGNRKRKEVLHFLSDCSSGLRFLHGVMKKIHRDIKPPNIFLRTETDVEGITRLVAKIGDLGLVTDRSNPKGEFYFERSQGGGAGAYLAPEIKGIALKTKRDPVVHGVPKYDEKIDIYALGGVFFDLLFLEPEDAYSECRWLIYEKFRSEFPDYFPLIHQMLGGKEEKHQRPPAFEVEDEAHRWLQEWLQSPEGAAEDNRESVRGEEDGEKGMQGKEKENRERNKMAPPAMTEYEKLMKREAMKEEERKRRRIEEEELKRKEMALMTWVLKTGLKISFVLLLAFLLYYFHERLGSQ
ncbi:unnamed protein product, partial [Cyprideis torosa]